MKELRAFWAGLKDGWRQPYELSTSSNMLYLVNQVVFGSDEWVEQAWILLEAMDKGASIGQFLRAGTKAESWREGYWPFEWRKSNG